jgi:glutathione S-transferase
MYRLYYYPVTIAMAPHAALEEIGVPFELVNVDIRGAVPPEYFGIQPMGRVPALEDDGFTMFESAAILMYLADKHSEARLAPAPGERDRGRYYQWIVFLAGTVYATLKVHGYPHRFAPEGASLEATTAKAARILDDLWRKVEVMLGDGPHILGRRFSAADLYLHQFTTWFTPDMAPLSSYPRLEAFGRRIGARPAVQRMLASHGMA